MKRMFLKYLVESCLIVFSVLFALFINKSYDDYNTGQRKMIALESIKKEIVTNRELIEGWRGHHMMIRDRINDILNLQNDSLRTEFKKYDYFNIALLTDQKNLLDGTLISTAWESARTTGIIAEFDFVTTKELTEVYQLQEMLINKTLAKILDYYYQSESHNIDQLDEVLRQYQLRFFELTGQEALLHQLYNEILGKI